MHQMGKKRTSVTQKNTNFWQISISRNLYHDNISLYASTRETTAWKRPYSSDTHWSTFFTSRQKPGSNSPRLQINLFQVNLHVRGEKLTRICFVFFYSNVWRLKTSWGQPLSLRQKTFSRSSSVLGSKKFAVIFTAEAKKLARKAHHHKLTRKVHTRGKIWLRSPSLSKHKLAWRIPKLLFNFSRAASTCDSIPSWFN